MAWWTVANNAEALSVLSAMPWAQVEARDARGRTALHRAASRGDAASVAALLAAGADACAREPSGSTPLTLVLERRAPCVACVAALLAGGADADAADARATPLIYSARRGAPDALALLLRAGASVDRADGSGKTALFWAAAEGQLECVRALLAAGARVDAAATGGTTPLHAACSRGGAARPQVVAALLAAGAHANASGVLLRGSPLQAALAQRDTAVAEMLRAAGARD